MTTFFCDYEGGNNANDGTTFANRWKDLTNGATAARIAPGDTIRIMASPDATSLGITGAWTDGPLQATVVPTSSTNATPIVMTKAGHGLVTGDTIIVNGHTTNTNANGVWDVTVSGNDFTLLNADGSNSIGNGVGGATGTFRKITNCVVKLASALTTNVAIFGNRGAKANWTASANVTNTVITTDFKEGGECQQIAIAAGFTTGLAAYFPTGTVDLSGYQQLSFWIKQTVGTIGAASSISLVLCSDTAGAAAVNTCNIPLLGALNQWSPITVDLATALGSSIQSIAFYVNTDNGAQTFLLDNIIACKASSSADSLSNVSLISKNTGTEGMFGIQSINGTRVMLDRDTNCIPAASPQRGYSGTTETVTTYKKETTKTVMAALSATQIQVVQDSGTIGNLIAFSGGWDRTNMSTQTGETIFDGQNGFGQGLVSSNKSYYSLDISVCRYNIGYYLNSVETNNSYIIKNIMSCSNAGFSMNTGTPIKNTVIIDNINCNSAGINFDKQNSSITILNCNSNNSAGMTLGRSGHNIINISKANNNGTYGVSFSVGSDNNVINLSESKGNGSASISNTNGINYARNSVFDSTIKLAGQLAFANSFIWSTNENNDTNTHFGYTDGGLISSDIATRHTASGISWKLSPTSTTRASNYPLPLKMATVAVVSGIAKTVNVWFRRTNTGLTARLICYGGQLSGVSDTSTSMTAAADTWEQLSVTVTATQSGVLEFYAECWGGTTYSCYVDDVSFS